MSSTIISDSANEFYRRYANDSTVREKIFGPTITQSGDECIHAHYSGKGEVSVNGNKWKSFSTSHPTNGGDWLDYVREKDYISNWLDGIKALYSYAGETWQSPEYSAPEKEVKPSKRRVITKENEANLKASLTEALKTSQLALDYLAKENIGLDDAIAMGFGFVTQSISEKFPEVFAQEDIGRLAIPVKQLDSTFYTCRYLKEIKPKDKIPKYRNTKEAEKSGFAGETLIGNKNRLFVVEGFKDAVLLNYREQQTNKRNQITYLGVGGCALNENQLTGLLSIVDKKKPQDIIIAFDNTVGSDPSGYQGTVKTILTLMPLLSQAQNLDLLYCSDWDEISKKQVVKDAGELLNKLGYDDCVSSAFAAVQSWDHFLVGYLIKARGADDQSVARKAFSKITEALIKCQQSDIDRFCNLTELSQLTSESDRLLFLQTLEDERAKHLKREYCSNLTAHQSKLDHAIKYENLDAIAKLKAEFPAPPGPDDFPTSTYREILQKMQKTTKKYKTYLSEEIDKEAGWKPGAMQIIVGYTGNGKTTLMTWAALKQLQNSDRKVVFFSYEETEESITKKMILQAYGFALSTEKGKFGFIALGETEFDDAVNAYLEGQYSGKDREDKLLKQAVAEIGGYIETGRLRIVDTVEYIPPVNELCTLIGKNIKKNGTDIFFVDYIQKIPPDPNGKNEANWLKIKSISAALTQSALTYNVPIILGAQANREKNDKADKMPECHNIREGSDIGQDAFSVFGILLTRHDPKAEEPKSDKKKFKVETHEGIARYELEIQKNRGGECKRYEGEMFLNWGGIHFPKP
jgi:hypothetical protein